MDDQRVTVDLNADVGEGRGPSPDGGDEALLRFVTSVHVACGFHAGDADSMRRTVAAAAAAGVAVGAHPSYPDRSGFGRRSMDRPPDQVAEDVAAQLEAIDRIARDAGTRLCSVKPHGALYARVATDEECAAAVASAIARHGPGLRLVLPAGSSALTAAAARGVAVMAEAFCDRGYLADGTLAPRGAPGALVTDPEEAARRAVALASRARVVSVDGTELRVRAGTICVHADTPGSVAIAAGVRRALDRAGVVVAAPPAPVGRTP